MENGRCAEPRPGSGSAEDGRVRSNKHLMPMAGLAKGRRALVAGCGCGCVCVSCGEVLDAPISRLTACRDGEI